MALCSENADALGPLIPAGILPKDAKQSFEMEKTLRKLMMC